MFWCTHDRWQEAWDAFTSQLRLRPVRATAARFWCDWYAGITAGILAEFACSEPVLSEALAIAREMDDPQMIALAHLAIGEDCLLQGRLAEAQDWTDGAVAVDRQLVPRHFLPYYLFNAGWTALRQRRLESAIALLDDAIAVGSEIGDAYSLSISLPLRASAAVVKDDLARAQEFLLRAEDVSRPLPNAGLGTARIGLGRLALLGGDTHRAAEYFWSTLDDAVTAGRRVQICESLEGLALIAQAHNDTHVAAYLLGAVESARTSLYRGRPPKYGRRLEAAMEDLRHTLGDADFDHARMAGQRMTLNDAVAYAEAAFCDGWGKLIGFVGTTGSKLKPT